MRKRRLADAGNVLDQQVPAREQAREAEANLPFLAEDDVVESGDCAGDEACDAGLASCCRLSVATDHVVTPRCQGGEPSQLFAELRELPVEFRNAVAFLRTTLSGAFATKFALASLAAHLSRSCCVRDKRLSSRAIPRKRHRRVVQTARGSCGRR